MKQGLLDKVAEQNHAFISSLRILPHLKWAALRDLYYLKDKEQYPLKEWEEAVSYLLGCTVVFQSYDPSRNGRKLFRICWAALWCFSPMRRSPTA